jgi:hypothetical protein
MAEMGTFSHIISNGFRTCVVVVHSLRWVQLAVGTDTLIKQVQGMKCRMRALVFNKQTGLFSLHNLRWISDLDYCIPFPKLG